MIPSVKSKKLETYGLAFPPEAGEVDIELICYRDGAPRSPGKAFHFRRVVDLLWNTEQSSKKFIWHPWAEEMNEATAQNNYLAVGGCASSGKTDFYAVWGLVEWLCAPHCTQVLYTSTSLKDSRKRIWSTVEDYFQANAGLPGKLVSSLGVIRFSGAGLTSDKFGLSLIACDKTHEREAMSKFLGFKAARLRLVADELPELSESVLTTAYSNLSINPDFRMVGIGNPKSHFDPFGMFAEPVDGWASVNESFYRWKTRRGTFIRFDGERSPNLLLGETKYPFLFTQEKLDEAQKLGERSPAYYRMVKGFWCPTGEDDTVYSEQEIEKYHGTELAEWSPVAPKVRVAALDASFTSGGDRCVLRFGYAGTGVSGVKTLEFSESVLLTEDVTSREPLTYQLCQQVKEHCNKRGVSPRNFALDSTSAGGPFADVLAVIWAPDFLRVNFSGAASTRPVSSSEKNVPANDRYYDRVTELWFSGKELLRAGQIRGLDATTIREMTTRRFSTYKGKKMLLMVESKVQMKSRTNESPDHADAAFVMVELCRTRLGFVSAEKVTSAAPRDKLGEGYGKPTSPYMQAARRLSMAGRAGRTLKR